MYDCVSGYMSLKRTSEHVRHAEGDIVNGKDAVLIDGALKEATSELHRHSVQYFGLFDKWAAQAWVRELDAEHSALEAGFLMHTVAQPNPWTNSGITVDSKRYMSRAVAVFSSQNNDSPVALVAAACDQAMSTLSADINIKIGPPKQERRVIEKAHDYGYDKIFDYARLTLVIPDSSLLPHVVRSLASSRHFEIVRAKNRFGAKYNAGESAGYRDYQLLVRLPTTQWIVEVLKPHTL